MIKKLIIFMVAVIVSINVNAQITIQKNVKDDAVVAKGSVFSQMEIRQSSTDSTYYVQFLEHDSEHYPFKLYLGKTKESSLESLNQIIGLTESIGDDDNVTFNDFKGNKFLIYRVDTGWASTGFSIEALDINTVNGFNVDKGHAKCTYWNNKYLIKLKNNFVKTKLKN